MGVAVAVGGYLLGSLLPAVWIVRRRTGKAPWELGDNPGGSGVWRLAGPAAGILTVLFDVIKGIIPVIVAQHVGLRGLWFVAAATSPVIGHNWPVYTGFKGGRGFACATGILIYLAPWEMILPYVLGVLVGLKKKWVPAVGVVAFPLGLLLMRIKAVDPQMIFTAISVMAFVGVRQTPWLLRQFLDRKNCGK